MEERKSDISDILDRLGILVMVLGIFGSIIMLFICINDHEETTGAIYLIAGSFFSVLFGCLILGFARLIDSSEETAYNTAEILKKMSATADGEKSSPSYTKAEEKMVEDEIQQKLEKFETIN